MCFFYKYVWLRKLGGLKKIINILRNLIFKKNDRMIVFVRLECILLMLDFGYYD